MIGAGNVATHLAVALKNCGYRISQIYGRTEISAAELAKKTNAGFTTNLNDIERNADVYFYCLSDHALENFISNFNGNSGLHIHTAGSISIDIFSGRKKNYGVIYPLQTLSKNKEINFNEVPLFTEANNPENLEKANAIAKNISKKVFEINSANRMKLHISAVFACNFTNYFYKLAKDLLDESNLPFDLIVPLIEETVEKLKYLSPQQAQTGPAIRGDRNVIEKHLVALEYNKDKQKLYSIISELIIKEQQQ